MTQADDYSCERVVPNPRPVFCEYLVVGFRYNIYVICFSAVARMLYQLEKYFLYP